MIVWGLVLAAGAALAQAQAAPAQADTGAWLERMGTAVEQLNYVGTFVHITDDETETMRVIHRVRGDEVKERLVSLGGTGREVLRTNEETTCILQAERAVLIDRHPARRPPPLHVSLPKYTAALEQYYEFIDHGDDRVAERAAHVIEVRPRDAYRYGYRLWLDYETAMPLQSVRVTNEGKAVERVMFTEIRFPEHIDDSELEPEISDVGFTRHVRDTRQLPTSPAEVGWEAKELPTGFTLAAADNEDGQASGEHLVYSDGLTSVSVFIESLENERPVQGFTVLGGSSAFSTTVEGYQVTVVGEVPEPTARMIGDSMRPLALDQRR
jgi:sigma-E factor negative regulatory protein RseB